MFYPFASKEESMFVELMATNLVLKKWRQNPMSTKMEIGVWHCWQTGRRERSPAVGIRGTEDEEISAATRTNQILKVFPEDWDGCLTIG